MTLAATLAQLVDLAQVAGVATVAVGVVAFVSSRREARRSHAAAVYVEVLEWQTYPGSNRQPVPYTRVAVWNNSSLPVKDVSIALHEWGRRTRVWKSWFPAFQWTGTRISGRHVPLLRPRSRSAILDFDGVHPPAPADKVDTFVPDVVIKFRDGFGRTWTRWPDGRLSRGR